MNVRSEDGFTIVETVVAAILLAIGAIAVLGAFDGARRATFRAEQSQVASDIAQRELEALRAKPYTQLALTSAPATSERPRQPLLAGRAAPTSRSTRIGPTSRRW